MSQPMLHLKEQSLGQKPSRWDSIPMSWMVSTDTQAREILQRSVMPSVGTPRLITRAVYFLNRPHSSREGFRDRD